MANSKSFSKKLTIAAILSIALISAMLVGSMSLASITPVAFAQSSNHTAQQQNSNHASSNHAQQGSQAVYDANGRIVGYFIPANTTQQGSTMAGQMGGSMAGGNSGGSMGGGHTGGSMAGSSVIDLTLAATIAASVGVGGFAAYKVYEIKQKAKIKTKAT